MDASCPCSIISHCSFHSRYTFSYCRYFRYHFQFYCSIFAAITDRKYQVSSFSIPLRLKRRGDKIIAYPLRWGSNLMSSLLDANAYLIVPPRQVIREGEEVKVNLLGAAEFNRIVGE